MHAVALIVWDEVPVFELAPPCEIFGVDRPDLASPWYRMLICAPGRGPVPHRRTPAPRRRLVAVR
jgi:hypothetical protein